ncbi:MAG: signal peptidase II [Lachnospiraceae bacterium]|nr:signal peptidase II [Lachnospiraceae bacterium]
MTNSKKKPFLSVLCGGVCAVILAGLDLWTKSFAASRLASGPIELIPGVFELRYLENRGAAFSILQNGRAFFIPVTVIVLIALVILSLRMPGDKKYRPLRILMIFVAAGALGNLYDRIFLRYVRDFLYISLIDFPIFNVADMYVTVSAILLAVLLLFRYKDEDFSFLHPAKQNKTKEAP